MSDLATAYGEMILRDGFFQADPHPGNILINKKGKANTLFTCLFIVTCLMIGGKFSWTYPQNSHMLFLHNSELQSQSEFCTNRNNSQLL